MSRDKHRSKRRRLELLTAAARLADTRGPGFGIALNCERGLAMENPDLQRLLSEGLLELKRPRIGARTRLTIAVITPAGRSFLAESGCDSA